jgi:hypothetical protein
MVLMDFLEVNNIWMSNRESNVIPSDYWSFYENIPVECTKRDCLPESDVNEDDKDSDLD